MVSTQLFPVGCISIASWNIGGAHRVSPSGKLWDSKGEDVAHVTNSFHVMNPHTICLQESHIRSNTSNVSGRMIAGEIAGRLGMRQVYDTQQNPSHIDSQYQLSLSTISHIPFVNTEYHTFPTPTFPVRLPGRDEDIPDDKMHRKGMQVVQLANGISVVNFQLLPGRLLGFDYGQGRGVAFAEQINNVLSERLPDDGPLIVCCDANYDETGRTPIEEVFPALQERSLRQVLPRNTPTRFTETGARLANDYVFVSKDLGVRRAIVRENLADGLDHFPLEVVIYERGKS
jgi:hypothetical protein